MIVVKRPTKCIGCNLGAECRVSLFTEMSYI